MHDPSKLGPLPESKDEILDRLSRISLGWLETEADPFLRVQAATAVPRTLLPIGEIDLALEILTALEARILPATSNYPHFYMVLANRAYCYDALAYRATQTGDLELAQDHHRQVVALIHRIKEIETEAGYPHVVYQSWHAMALAHAHFHLGEEKQLQQALDDVAQFPTQARQLAWWYPKLYPDEKFQRRVKDALEHRSRI